MLTPDRAKVLTALFLSLLLHTLIYATWPHLQAVSSMPILIQGELLVPRIEDAPPPPPATEPPPPPPPEAKPEPRPELPPKPRDESKPAPRGKSDTGVALPLIAERADDATANDYLVPEAPPLEPGDKLPFASKTGTTALQDYTPSHASVTQGDGGNAEDPVDRDVLAEYGNRLRDRAAQFGVYPALAQWRGWQGRVKVWVRYARSGEAYQIQIKESSGQKVLDEQALTMVAQACKDFVLPDALASKAFSVIVPVDFKLK